jgi:hypothetical protein
MSNVIGIAGLHPGLGRFGCGTAAAGRVGARARVGCGEALVVAGERIRALAGGAVPGIAVLVTGPKGVRGCGGGRVC